MTGARRRVVLDYVAAYDEPISVARGDAISLTGRVDLWDGHVWLWAIAPQGREGWVPDDLVADDGGVTVARRDYSADELTCKAGDIVFVLETTHGWALCRAVDEAGAEGAGWVPLRHLGPPLGR